jgi:hypothetical protein
MPSYLDRTFCSRPESECTCDAYNRLTPEGRAAAEARAPRIPGEDLRIQFTDASMALLGLLLAFTFSLSLARHDQRRLAAIADGNSIGDFYTCATLLKEPGRS